MNIDDTKRQLKSGGYLARYLVETGRGDVGGVSEKQIRCPDKSKHAHGDTNPSARYYNDGGNEHIHCHGCGGHWDLFSLVSLDRGLDFMGAVQWCAEHWNIADITATAGKVAANATPAAQTVAQYLAECATHYSETDYLRKRGISDEVARRFKIGYDPKERRVVFPQGAGYSARAIDDDNPLRYKYPKGVSVSPVNLEALWNADKAPVFIVEGQIDALSVIEGGGVAVGLGGITHQKAVLDAITARPIAVSVCVSFDNDKHKDTREKERQLSDALARLNVRLFTANLYPDGCKDANDALLKDRGALATAIATAIKCAKVVEQAATLPARYTLADVPEPPTEANNPQAIFGNGYLRKGQGLMIVSTSGAGKSVMSIQLAMFWALGKTLWGIKPVRPLKVGVIQSEDDADELAYFRTNMRGGLKADYGWTDDELDRAIKGVVFERVIGKTGDAFTSRLKEIQAEQCYDVVIVNPLFSFFGADLSNNKDDAHFFREEIDPLIKNPAYGFAIVFVHHANKPPKSADRKGWGTDVFAQYIGAGGTDVAGWTRAQLVLMPIDGHAGWFKLIAAKRGGKLGWKDADGNTTYERIICYGKNFVYWRTPNPEEIPADILKDAARTAKADDMSEAEARQKMLDHLRTKGAMPKTDLFNWCAATFTGFKSKEAKPCRLAYDDVTNHPERYGIEITKGKRGAQVLNFVTVLPGMEDAGANDGETPTEPKGAHVSDYDLGDGATADDIVAVQDARGL